MHFLLNYFLGFWFHSSDDRVDSQKKWANRKSAKKKEMLPGLGRARHWRIVDQFSFQKSVLQKYGCVRCIVPGRLDQEKYEKQFKISAHCFTSGLLRAFTMATCLMNSRAARAGTSSRDDGTILCAVQYGCHSPCVAVGALEVWLVRPSNWNFKFSFILITLKLPRVVSAFVLDRARLEQDVMWCCSDLSDRRLCYLSPCGISG